MSRTISDIIKAELDRINKINTISQTVINKHACVACQTETILLLSEQGVFIVMNDVMIAYITRNRTDVVQFIVSIDECEYHVARAINRKQMIEA